VWVTCFFDLLLAATIPVSFWAVYARTCLRPANCAPQAATNKVKSVSLFSKTESSTKIKTVHLPKGLPRFRCSWALVHLIRGQNSLIASSIVPPMPLSVLIWPLRAGIFATIAFETPSVMHICRFFGVFVPEDLTSPTF
jgi:hypothetical protein